MLSKNRHGTPRLCPFGRRRIRVCLFLFTLMHQYNHPFIEYGQMSVNLISKGMSGDMCAIERRLEDVGYQRLSAYWKPFQDYQGHINVSIEEIWNIYCFDRSLRLCLLDAIERIEVAIRNKLVHIFARKYGPFGYLEQKNFPDADVEEWAKWILKLNPSNKRSNNALVKDFRAQYTNQHLPLWIACELMDFGASVRFFEFAEKKIKQEVAQYLKIVSTDVLLSWLKQLNDVRNACAHHNRVWNRGWSKQPQFSKNQWEWYASFDVASGKWVPDSSKSKLSFSQSKTGVVLTICHLLLKQVANTSQWKNRVFQLFSEPRFASIPLAWMGLPKDWKTHPLWK